MPVLKSEERKMITVQGESTVLTTQEVKEMRLKGRGEQATGVKIVCVECLSSFKLVLNGLIIFCTRLDLCGKKISITSRGTVPHPISCTLMKVELLEAKSCSLLCCSDVMLLRLALNDFSNRILVYRKTN